MQRTVSREQMAFAVRNLGTAGYAIGFVTFVFLTLFSVSMAWILKHSHEVPKPLSPQSEIGSAKEISVTGRR